MQWIGRIEGYRTKWGPPEVQVLTFRERQVMQLVAEGKGTQEIADCLGISPRTVKVHVASVFDKLGVNRRTEAVALLMSQAHQLGARAS